MRLLARRKEDMVAVIADPTDMTLMDRTGAVRSVQGADVFLPVETLEELWSPEYLERLARTYWRFLSRVTLGLIRVHYGEEERAVVLWRRPFVLLRFQPPEYELAPEQGIVRWRIRDGLLVSRRDEGYLEIDVRQCPCEEPGKAKIHIEVEVSNFYPAIASWLTRFVYTNTQSRIHVLVTHGFLRSLSRLDLEESPVGRFAPGVADGNGRRPTAPEDQTVGDTPWMTVGALAAAGALGAATAVYVWRERHSPRGRRNRRRRVLSPFASR
jgi:hypothetical protein